MYNLVYKTCSIESEKLKIGNRTLVIIAVVVTPIITSIISVLVTKFFIE